MKITNPAHPYFNQDVKVLEYHQDGSEKVDLFLLESEMIIEASVSDIAKVEESIVPKSRKEFYEYVQKTTTSRVHIEHTLKSLISKNHIQLKGITEEELLSMTRNTELDKTEFLDIFRTMRDEGKLDFNLTNAIYQKPNYSDKRKPSRSHARK